MLLMYAVNKNGFLGDECLLSFLQEYCSHARPKTEYIATLSEIHAPPKFRQVLEILTDIYSWMR